MLETANDEKTENAPNLHLKTSLPIIRASSAVDLEAGRGVARPSTTSPTLMRSSLAPPGIFHRNGSAPASTTSLPVQGIEPAPTHRRCRNRRRRQQSQQAQNGASAGGAVPRPRRANSLPANPARPELTHAPTGQPFDWRKGWDTLLQPTKKIVSRPTLTQCFVNTVKYSWINVMLLLLPVAWAVSSIRNDRFHIFVPFDHPVGSLTWRMLVGNPLSRCIHHLRSKLYRANCRRSL
ncbi:hypothetical protein FRB91_010361 [Serendipita sp. 411]|nr:hypothetical protein FRB91_010361 [Serendipita sp. 411]